MQLSKSQKVFSKEQYKKELFNQTMTLVSLSESDKIHKKTLDEKPKQIDIINSSINALTHLLGITSKEVQEEAQVFGRIFTWNSGLMK